MSDPSIQPILVWMEREGDRFSRVSLEVLSHSRALADDLGCDLFALASGETTQDLESAVARTGATRLYLMPSLAEGPPTNAATIACIAAACEIASPGLVVMASTHAIRDVIGGLSVAIDAAAVPGVRSFRWDGSTLAAESVDRMSGELERMIGRAERYVVTIMPGAFDIENRDGAIETEVLNRPKFRLENLCVETVGRPPEQPDLTRADVVVAAGRGVRDARGRDLIYRLAATLGGSVGATRAAVESGLFPPDSLVGQSGAEVAPRLYVAVGLSGAVQHAGGMIGSDTIVAVNRDPRASIFQYATYGIVGDLYEVVPLLIKTIEQRGSVLS